MIIISMVILQDFKVSYWILTPIFCILSSFKIYIINETNPKVVSNIKMIDWKISFSWIK